MVRSLALLLTVLTGFSGLVYEVAWQRYLATLLGSDSEATAAVLAIFLGGLALGYGLFGRITQGLVARSARQGGAPRLLLFYGGIEAAIGVYAWVFPALFAAARAVSLWLPTGGGGLAFAFDVALAALLIGPPTVLMGATIPILTQALARSLADATRFHALVYALNTAGAFAGALAAGFWLVPALGLVGILRATGVVNLFAGSAFLILGARARAAAAAPQTRGGPVEAFAVYAAIAALLGFAMMAIQVVLIRMGGLSLGSSHFTFAMVVAVFVLCIALGSLAVSALPRIPRALIVANQWVLAGLFLALYAPLENAPYWAHVLRTLFRDTPAAFYPYHFGVFLSVLVVIGTPVALGGAALPLLFHHLRREVGDLGRTAGRLYSWNTVGSLFGALLGGYVLFFWLDLHAVYRVAVAALLLAAALLTLRIFRRRGAVAAAVLGVTGAAVLLLLPAWRPDRLAAGLFRVRQPQGWELAGADHYFDQATWKVLFYQDDPATSVAVVDFGYLSRTGKLYRSIINNGKSDGDITADYPTMALLAILPSLYAKRVERAFVIGLGTGVTTGELASLVSMREVVVAEISSGVVAASPLFDYGNLGVSKSPKVRIVHSDAYRALQRSSGLYDVIVSEPSNPWVTGVEMLFSREFLESARRRLTPGGVYAQWFHTYAMDRPTVELVMRTYAEVFDDVAVWYGLGPDLVLLGFNEGSRGDELRRVFQRARQPDLRAGLARAGIESVPALLAHELLPRGVVHALGLSGPVHTLLHPILSHRAARAFYVGDTAREPGAAGLEAARVGAQRSLMRRYLERVAEVPRGWRRAVAVEACKYRADECAVLLARWGIESPESVARAHLLKQVQRRSGFGAITPDVLRWLAYLLGEGDPPADGEVDLETARRSTRLFRRYYYPALPFRRQALAAIWDACGAKDGQLEACRRGREAVERELGDLRVEAADLL